MDVIYGCPGEMGWTGQIVLLIRIAAEAVGGRLIRHSCRQNLHYGCGCLEDELANSTYVIFLF
jgi:hypothetical protein